MRAVPPPPATALSCFVGHLPRKRGRKTKVAIFSSPACGGSGEPGSPGEPMGGYWIARDEEASWEDKNNG